MKRVYCLYRVSTKKQVDVTTDDLPMQKQACHEFAKKQGWKIIKEVSEKGVSGSKVSAEKRDAIHTLRAAALKKEFDILLVFMFDRLGRIDSETPFIVEWFVDKGIEVWSTQEGQQRIDNHGDKLMNYLRYWQASNETDKMSIRISTRIGQMTEDGIFNGASPGYGYRLVRGVRKNNKGIDCCGLAVNEAEAEIVRLIFDKTVNEKVGSHRLATFLNEQGLRTQKGAKWQSINIKRILENKIYIGIYHRGKASAPLDESLAIIPQKIFDKAQLILEERSKANRAKASVSIDNKSKSLLTGKIFCGSCGGRLSPSCYVDNYQLADGTPRQYKKQKYYCFNKSRHLPCCGEHTSYLGERIDEAVLKNVQILFSNITPPTKIDIIKKRIENRLVGAKKKKKGLQNSLRNSEQKIEKLHHEICKAINGESLFTESDIAASINLQKENISLVKLQILELDKEIKRDGYTSEELEALYAELIGWKKKFKASSLTDQKIILSDYLQKVEVFSYGKILIHINKNYSQFCSDSDILEISAE